MAGFAVLIAPDSPTQVLESDFQNLIQLTATHKQLMLPPANAFGVNCIAGKLDSPATIHPGIVRDEPTGSWLLASGTVVALSGFNHPHTVLVRLLRDYIENGAKALEGYDGHFALVIFNGLNGSLSVVSDPIGMFSIFYWQQGSRILLSNSALAIATQTHSKADILAVEHFLRMGNLVGDRTLWQGVRRLLGGTILCAAEGRVTQAEYWRPTYDKSLASLSFNEALCHAMSLLTHTVSRILEREGKTWVDLTGGFDSRLVAMLVAKIDSPFSAYCMGPNENLDVRLSRKISQEMRWEYENTQLSDEWGPDQYPWFNAALGCGDGRTSVLRLAVTMRGFEERNRTIKRNVTGVGGENMRGYGWQTERADMGRTSKLNFEAFIDNLLPSSFPLNVMRHDRTREIKQELSDAIHQSVSKYAEFPNTVQIDRIEIGRDANHGGAYLSSIAGINRSLAPLCFKEVVNFAFSLNYRWKYPRHHIFVRTLLERENKSLANLSTTTGGPAIPIRFENAHRFWPLWKDMTNRAIAIGSKKILGKAVQVWPRPHQPEYPLPTWRSAFHDYALSQGMLSPDTMCSGALYKHNELTEFVKVDRTERNRNIEFLDRAISVEMAMRTVGSNFD
jgi:asparagine synthetase B (glutamine-hydrolysing)